jgi:preprotein translocase subunit YajC
LNFVGIADFVRSANFGVIAQAGLLAQEPPGGITSLIPFMWLVPVIILYVFLIQRPQRRQQAQQEMMLKNIKKNDRVITTSGIYGVVTNVQSDADEVTIRVDESNNTKIRMTLSAVARVVASDGGDEKESK